MKNIKELRDQMCDVFGELQNGNLELGLAKELSNAAGKIISTAKVELEYAKLNKIKKNIDFLNY